MCSHVNMTSLSTALGGRISLVGMAASGLITHSPPAAPIRLLVHHMSFDASCLKATVVGSEILHETS